MKLIPIYTWNKGIFELNAQRRKISNHPWAQGVILLICVMVAMTLANLPFTKELYRSILETSLAIHVEMPGRGVLEFPRGMTVEKFINDILMVVFFFTVGLEIRREVAYGELSTPKKAVMPVIAAFGGVLVPAIIYTIINHGTAASSGWGIPTATDIAFAVCILSVLGDKVPISLKVFLTALAIADDLIAILVVAIFYGGHIKLGLLLIALVVIILTLALRRLGEKHVSVYLALAFCVWVLFYYSGIHATMSGVVMAFLIPSDARYSRSYFKQKWTKYNKLFELYQEPDKFPSEAQSFCLRRFSEIASNSMGMSYRVEQILSPWVNFLIMPVFAIANAGVEIVNLSDFNVFYFNPALGSVSLGVFLGLLVGKPVGITLASWIAIKRKVGEMPVGADMKMFFAVACLGGIGFTMSIFVDTLSFGNQSPAVMESMRNAGKIAVLLGSVCSGILGSVLINLFHRLDKRKN